MKKIVTTLFAVCSIVGLHAQTDTFSNNPQDSVAIVLPWGSNFDKPVFTPKCAEDTWMTARNKWLLAHPDTNEAKNGAHIGLRGENIDIADSLAY